MFWRDEASCCFSTSAPRRDLRIIPSTQLLTQLLTQVPLLMQDAATAVEPMGLLLSATGNLHSTPQTRTL